MGTWIGWTVVAVAVGWFVVGAVVARRAYQWHRDRSRSRGVALVAAIAAGLVWPVTLYVWDLDWASTGRDRRRTNR
jgi:hypothetical protein